MEKEIKMAINNHQMWIDSMGEKGKKINLEEKKIEGGEWKNVNLTQGNIIECMFKDITIECWDFYAAMLCSSCFEKALISSVDFVKANMSYIQFLNSNLKNTNLSKTDLSFSVFENVEINSCKFINTLLDGARFTNVSLNNIDLTGAWIENVIFCNDIVLKDICGLDEAHIKNIIIETEEQLVNLKEQEAIQWLKTKFL